MEVMTMPRFIKSAIGDSWWMPTAIFLSLVSIALGWNVFRILVLHLSKGWPLKLAIGIEILTVLTLINAFVAPFVSFCRGKFWRGFVQFMLALGAVLLAKDICSALMESF